jgi:hypothetical protein
MEFAVEGMREKEACCGTFLTQVVERQVYAVV